MNKVLNYPLAQEERGDEAPATHASSSSCRSEDYCLEAITLGAGPGGKRPLLPIRRTRSLDRHCKFH